VSARHRQLKRKINAAKDALAERQVDLVAYVRVIADMSKHGSPITFLLVGRDATQRDCERLRAVIEDLERTQL
jgi:hypothetical protein